MEERALVRELTRLRNLPATKEDWLDLHETIARYQDRCLARAIAGSPDREDIVATIQRLAGLAS